MQLLPELPWIVKILGSLGIILLANRLLKRLTLSMAIGTWLLALFAGHSTAEIISITSNRLFNVKHINFILVIAQVCWLSQQMAATGLMADLVNLIQGRLTPRGSISVLPTVMGLLPMPGGALFSAPLVDNCDQEKKVKPELKSAINFWFRHIWEFWSSMFPGPLLAMEIAGLSTLEYFVVGFPLCLIAVAAGYFFLLREIPASGRVTGSTEPAFFRRFFSLITPISIVVGAYILYQFIPAGLRWDNNYFPISLGIIGASLWLQHARTLPAVKWRQVIFQKKIITLTMQMSMIRVYGAFIEAKLPDGTPLVAKFSAELASYGIPVMIMVMLIPFISGLATGIGAGYVGASFPIVLRLLGVNPGFSAILSTLVLAQGFGMAGMLLSPVHVCLLVSNEYFGTKLGPTLSKLIKPAMIVIGSAILFHFVYPFLF
jgi:integral membrane protein (TIGR00529 family)